MKYWLLLILPFLTSGLAAIAESQQQEVFSRGLSRKDIERISESDTTDDIIKKLGRPEPIAVSLPFIFYRAADVPDHYYVFIFSNRNEGVLKGDDVIRKVSLSPSIVDEPRAFTIWPKPTEK